MTDVAPVVEDLALAGVERFRPSFVASRTGARVAEVHAALETLAEQGELDVHYELVCPNDDCHRTVAVFSAIEEIPIGSTVRCDPCGHEFEVALSNVWVYYTPSRALLLRLNRDHGERPKKKLLSLLKRARALLAMR